MPRECADQPWKQSTPVALLVRNLASEEPELGMDSLQTACNSSSLGTSHLTVEAASRSAVRVDKGRRVVAPASSFSENVFGYGGRPWRTWPERWDAIRRVMLEELKREEAGESFEVYEVGARTGYFSLNIAFYFPESFVIAAPHKESDDGANSDLQTLLSKADELGVTSRVATDSDCWDFDSVKALRAGSFHVDLILLLSVFHYIDQRSYKQYDRDGVSRVRGSLLLMANILSLASLHFIELPDPNPQSPLQYDRLPYVYRRFKTAAGFLQEAMKEAMALSGQRKKWRGLIYTSTGQWANTEDQSRRKVFVVSEA